MSASFVLYEVTSLESLLFAQPLPLQIWLASFAGPRGSFSRQCWCLMSGCWCSWGTLKRLTVLPAVGGGDLCLPMWLGGNESSICHCFVFFLHSGKQVNKFLPCQDHLLNVYLLTLHFLLLPDLCFSVWANGSLLWWHNSWIIYLLANLCFCCVLVPLCTFDLTCPLEIWEMTRQTECKYTDCASSKHSHKFKQKTTVGGSTMNVSD